MANSYTDLAVGQQNSMGGNPRRTRSQVRIGNQQKQADPSDLMVSGVREGVKSRKQQPQGVLIQNNNLKNMDIVGTTEYYHGTDPAWLETSSPHNRQFIEDAYRNYNT